jgi:hypothetical protein
MSFLIRPGTPLHQSQLQARALKAWRDAELIVQRRWDTFLLADRASSRAAFAAYLSALGEEAAAAGRLAETYSPLAGAA